MSRDGRPDDRADVAQPRLAHARATQLVDDAGQPFPNASPAGQLEVLDVRRARIGRAHQRQHPGAGGACRRHERLDRIASHQRVDRHHVRPEPRHGPEWCFDACEQRVGISPRCDVDIPALAVGDHQQPMRPCMHCDRLQRAPPGSAQPLEAGELRLRRHARLCRCVDHRPAVAEDRLCGPLRRRPLREITVAPRPQRCRIGVEPEHDLRLALGHPSDQGVAKRGCQAQRPFTALFRPLPALKRGTREAAI